MATRSNGERFRRVNSRCEEDEAELVAKIVEDESDGDFVDEDELKGDEDLRIVSDNVSSDRGDVDSPTPLTSTSEISDASATVKSVFGYLRRPTSSELSRRRKVDRNPPKGKKRSQGTCLSDPKSIMPQQRVKQHSDECFSVANNKLFCLACREEFSIKNSVIAGHTYLII